MNRLTRLEKPLVTMRAAWAACLLAVFLSGCKPAEEVKATPVRPVRTVTVELAQNLAATNFTGRIEAQEQPSLSFRIGGRMAERLVAVGARVMAGDVVARLDSENELNALRSSQAALASAESSFRQADGHYQRQSRLRARGVTSEADFEDAQQSRKTARARVDAAVAQLRTAENGVSFTTLKADAEGIVTAVGAEPGEVVAPGRMIVRLAREGGQDAVFDVPADVVRFYPENLVVSVALSSDPSVRITGRIREVSPQADPVTRTFRVRVGLVNSPASFRLGATVIATVAEASQTVMAIPATALITRERSPTVWIVDPQTMTVAKRVIEIQRSDPALAVVSKGLAPGDIVVTAGVDLLGAGQKIRLMGTEFQ